MISYFCLQIVLFMDKFIQKLSLPESFYIVAFLLIGVSMISYIIYYIYIAYKNEKNFKKFRKNIKIGDITTLGEVTNINVDEITIESKRKVDSLYPQYTGRSFSYEKEIK